MADLFNPYNITDAVWRIDKLSPNGKDATRCLDTLPATRHRRRTARAFVCSLASGSACLTIAESANLGTNAVTPQQTVLMNGQQQLLSPSSATVPPSPSPATLQANASPNKFVVTSDYIQQSIKNALKQENLNPEIEEKLLQLQRYQQEKQVKKEGVAPVSPAPSPVAPTPPAKPAPARKRPSAPAHDSTEGETPKKKVQRVEHKEGK
ncbi:hypothetical protein J6590_010919 [Homalodisca vitripennis]|nr:hypothetical protein J6590_010919 [Homalodisca vitripennis]